MSLRLFSLQAQQGLLHRSSSCDFVWRAHANAQCASRTRAPVATGLRAVADFRALPSSATFVSKAGMSSANLSRRKGGDEPRPPDILAEAEANQSRSGPEQGSFRALLLDVSFKPIDVLTWQRAVTLHLFGKVEALEFYDASVRSARAAHKLPAVLKVNVYVDARRQAAGRGSRVNRRNILIRDKFRCQYCGKGNGMNSGNLTIDHIMPQSRGGLNTWSNLVCACQRCNTKKGAKTPAEAGMRLRTVPKEPSQATLWGTVFGRWETCGDPPKEWEGYT